MSMATIVENFDEVYDKWDMICGIRSQSVTWESKEVSSMNTSTTIHGSEIGSFLSKIKDVFAQKCGGPDYYQYSNK